MAQHRRVLSTKAPRQSTSSLPDWDSTHDSIEGSAQPETYLAGSVKRLPSISFSMDARAHHKSNAPPRWQALQCISIVRWTLEHERRAIASRQRLAPHTTGERERRKLMHMQGGSTEHVITQVLFNSSAKQHKVWNHVRLVHTNTCSNNATCQTCGSVVHSENNWRLNQLSVCPIHC